MKKAKEFIPQRAMSIHAHPDDQDFTVSGTLAKWAQAGCEVISVIITSGDSGSNDPAKGADHKAELAELREDEQRAANRLLGVKETVFMRYPDGELVATIELRKDLTRLIRRFKPDVVLSGDPTAVLYGNSYVNHPDHRAASEAALYATFPSAGSRLLFADLLAEGLEPHNVKRLYIHGSEKPDTWVDISQTINLKIEALKQHASQPDTHNDVGKWLRDWAKEDGKKKGFKFAEAYRVMIFEKEEDHA